MIYKLDGVNLSDFGAYPIPASNECIALSGVYDLPKRKGTTEYNWGTSVEVFVDAEDIVLDGRTLTLNVAIRRTTESEYLQSLQDFKNACVNCCKLYTEFGEFDVVCKDSITVTRYPRHPFGTVQAKFYQEEVTFPALNIQAIDGEISINGYSLEKCFDSYISDFKKLEDIGKRIEINTTLPYTQSHYREPVDITLSCKMVGSDLISLYSKINQLHALCIHPGLKTLKTGNKTVKLYFKSGTSVKALTERMLSFDLKCRVIEWEI